MWKEKTLLMDEKAMGRAIRRIAHETVSYTHLTLPTIRLV